MKTIFTKKAPNPVGPYSQAIETKNLVFLSGQVGINPKSQKIDKTDVKGQTEQVIKNIKEILLAVNLSLENVANATCYLKNIQDFQAFNEIYSKYFDAVKPARTTVEAPNLPLGALIEIAVIAEKPVDKKTVKLLK